MSSEELLKPRYKVIANWPHQAYEIGAILGDRAALVRNLISSSNLSDYPSLFQKLEWWEERKVEDLQGYVKCNVKGEPWVFKVSEIIRVSDTGFEFTHTDNRIPSSWFAWQPAPATEQEYNDFINQSSNGK